MTHILQDATAGTRQEASAAVLACSQRQLCDAALAISTLHSAGYTSRLYRYTSLSLHSMYDR
eukprot:scaffold946_cov115-Isochrysis_galbana.AAC.6